MTAEVLSNPASQFDQTIVIAAGRNDGIRVYDAVVTQDGLVGQVTKVLRDTALVTLLTDKESAVTAQATTRPARSASSATARAPRTSSSSTASARTRS